MASLERMMLARYAIGVVLFGSLGFSGTPQALVFEKDAAGFVARGRQFSIHLGGDGAELTTDSTSVAMRLKGAARRVDPKGADFSPGKVNYLVGPVSDWRRDVAAYGKVRYSGVYPGVDLVFYGRDGRIEYDFNVAPGADPSAIQVQWDKARRLSLNQHGDLIISAADGQIQWDAPLIYQSVDGVRQTIPGRFKLLGRNRVGFEIGRFDPRRELVIDPVLAFSTYLGGSAREFSRGIATDAAGNIYVAGVTGSINLPVTSGVYQTGYAGNTVNLVSGDAFVAKYSPAGALIFLTFLGGKKDDAAMSLAVDAAGNVYVTGFSNSTDFPVTAGVVQNKLAGYSGVAFALAQGDAFVTKLSADGKTLIYSTYLGGTSDDTGFGIAVDSAGNAYVTGTTLSNNFPVSPDAYQKNYAGRGGQTGFPMFGDVPALAGGDVFVAKLTPTATALVYSTYIGGTSDDLASAIAIDGAGNAYVGGYTLSINFPTTAFAFQTHFNGVDFAQNFFFNFGDAFVLKLNPAGTGLVYSTYVGGNGDDVVLGLAIDSSGNVYATGCTDSTTFPASSTGFQTTYRGPTILPFLVDQLIGDGFVFKLNAAGTALGFASYLGGSGDDCGTAIGLDGGGNVIVAGMSNSTDFPVTSDAIQKTLSGPPYLQDGNSGGDAFVVQFSPTGTRTYATFLGGSSDDVILAMAVSSGTAYVAGLTGSQNFPTANAAQAKNGSTAASTMDAFVAAISGFAGSGGGTGPSISSVTNAFGDSSTIAPNTWVALKGTKLAPAGKSRIWQDADFANNRMPISLDGVSVKMNGKDAFVYFISETQINVLTPPDLTAGPVQVVLTNNGTASAAFTVQAQPYSESFFVYNGGPYVIAVHLDASRIGPPSLFPGLTTPAKPNEKIVLFANGFGPITPPVVSGSVTQSGPLPSLPVVKIGANPATVEFAGLISPGLYQFNIVVPAGTPDGDNSITASFAGLNTQAGTLITIQH